MRLSEFWQIAFQRADVGLWSGKRISTKYLRSGKDKGILVITKKNLLIAIQNYINKIHCTLLL